MTPMIWNFDEDAQEWVCSVSGTTYDGTTGDKVPAVMDFCYGYNGLTGYFDWNIRDDHNVYVFGMNPTALGAKEALVALADLHEDVCCFTKDATGETVLELNV